MNRDIHIFLFEAVLLKSKIKIDILAYNLLSFELLNTCRNDALSMTH